VKLIKPLNRINEQIRAREVRLVDAEGKQVGIVPIEQAVRKAQEAGLDLVEVAPDARPPVCRIFDYQKLVYDQQRRQREARKKAHQAALKEIKLRVTIDQHDLKVKTKHAREFLDAGDKVKLTIQYRGREITKQQLGIRLVEQVLAELGDIAEIEQQLTRQGRQQHLILTRKRDAAKKSASPAAAASGASRSKGPNEAGVGAAASGQGQALSIPAAPALERESAPADESED